MDNNKQKTLIEYLISSPDTFILCQQIVKPQYFFPEFKISVAFIKEYFEEYHSIPSPKTIKAETGVEYDTFEIKPHEINYVKNEIEKFCKRRALEIAVIEAPKYIANEDHAGLHKSILDAILVSLNKDLGVRYFKDVEERLKRMAEKSPVIPTGWDEVDTALFGGISRKELVLFAATSGGGKSISLSNLALNVCNQGYNVLYISLELSEDVVSQRFDTMFTGIGRDIWEDHASEIVTKVKSQEGVNGELDVVLMKSGTKANDIRAYLKEYQLTYEIMPDLLIIDYVDKMSPNEKMDLGNVFEKDKACSEQIRDLGIDYDMAVATASQLNRGAHQATSIGHEHIAGGISKINECDIYITVKLTEEMKAAGRCSYTFQKTRNSDGVGKTVYLKWLGKFLRIVNEDGDPNGLTFKKKSNVPILSGGSGNEILDFMNSSLK